MMGTMLRRFNVEIRAAGERATAAEALAKAKDAEIAQLVEALEQESAAATAESNESMSELDRARESREALEAEVVTLTEKLDKEKYFGRAANEGAAPAGTNPFASSGGSGGSAPARIFKKKKVKEGSMIVGAGFASSSDGRDRNPPKKAKRPPRRGGLNGGHSAASGAPNAPAVFGAPTGTGTTAAAFGGASPFGAPTPGAFGAAPYPFGGGAPNPAPALGGFGGSSAPAPSPFGGAVAPGASPFGAPNASAQSSTQTSTPWGASSSTPTPGISSSVQNACAHWNRSNCRYSGRCRSRHVCSTCGDSSHKAPQCPRGPGSLVGGGGGFSPTRVTDPSLVPANSRHAIMQHICAMSSNVGTSVEELRLQSK